MSFRISERTFFFCWSFWNFWTHEYKSGRQSTLMIFPSVREWSIANLTCFYEINKSSVAFGTMHILDDLRIRTRMLPRMSSVRLTTDRWTHGIDYQMWFEAHCQRRILFLVCVLHWEYTCECMIPEDIFYLYR